MRDTIFNTIDSSDLSYSLPDGSGLSFPLPGLHESQLVIKLFVFSFNLRRHTMSVPRGEFVLRADANAVITYSKYDYDCGELIEEAVLGLEESNRQFLRYYELFPEVMGFALGEADSVQTQKVIEMAGILEKLDGTMLRYYRAMAPEFWSWLEKLKV